MNQPKSFLAEVGELLHRHLPHLHHQEPANVSNSSAGSSLLPHRSCTEQRGCGR